MRTDNGSLDSARTAAPFVEVKVMKIIRSKEYYEQLWPIIGAEGRAMHYHAVQAENYKKIYTLTKGRKGIYRLLHQFAFKMNQRHYNAGMKIGKRQMVILINEMNELNKILKGES